MNLFFSFGSSWKGALGDLGPVATTFLKFFGPILTFVLALSFLGIFIHNIIPLAKKDTPPQERAAAKKSLLWWGLSIGAVLTVSIVITIIFFGFGQQIDKHAMTQKKASAPKGASQLISDFIKIKANNNLPNLNSIFKI